ncbi:MAG: electron transfer flavoprotein subunit beta/FixA family protein [Pseudomonadota bacterium]
MKIVVCLKQVPMVTELPWDPKTGRLMRGQAEGMMNPACKHALEAALRLKQAHGGQITALSMGPPQAEEVLYEALALGADQAFLLSDPRLAGADTLATSHTLARAIQSVLPDFDLALLGCHTTDSETGQVGPQLAEELDLPAAFNVEHLELAGRTLTVRRVSDDFLETLALDLPALLTITTQEFLPRETSLGGLERAFAQGAVGRLDAAAIGADPAKVGVAGSAGQILRVYSPAAQKKGLLLTGAVKKSVQELFDRYGDRLGGLIGQDLASEE